jgi:hypothetical protein
MGGLVCVLFLMGCCRYSGVRGGGKCPEEEHTTCSGGPTIVIVTSAVYGEREIMINFIYHNYKKCENVKNNKTVKNGILPLKMELFTLEFRVFWLFF